MRLLLWIYLLGTALPLLANSLQPPVKSSWTLAQNELSSAFDPFIDYGEFQDNVTEEESINFFRNGRSLTLSLRGGYEAITLNMRQIYGDAPLMGGSISFFLDLHFAFQVSGVFPAGHYNSLLNTTARFAHYGIDLKYYFNRQYLTKEVDFINPYFTFGPFWINIKTRIPINPNSPVIPIAQTPSAAVPSATPPPSNPKLSSEELQSLNALNAAGIKAGLGIEIPFIKQSFIGAEISYLYTILEHENQDLSKLTLPPPNYNPNQNLMNRFLFPNRPQVEGYRFFGDLVNIVILFGVNF